MPDRVAVAPPSRSNFFAQFDEASDEAPQPANVPLPPPRANFFAQFDEEQGPPMPPRPADVPLPPARPKDLGIGAQEFPPVQPLAGEAPAVTPRDIEGNLRPEDVDANGIPIATSLDPQAIPQAPGGKNNVLNDIYRRLGVDPRSTMNTDAAYDKQVQKREEAAQAYEGAQSDLERESRLEDEKIRRLERAAAEGNTFAQDQLAVLRSHKGAQPTVTEDAQYALDKARDAKLKEDQRSPAIVNPLRNAVESVPRTIGNQLADTGSAATRVVDKVFEPVDRLLGVDTAANDKKREAYWERRRRAVDGAFNTDPALASNFGQQVVDGIASTAGFMLTGGVAGKVFKVSPTLATALAGALPQAEQHWRMVDDYYKIHPEQAQDWKRWAAFATGFVSGTTEALPIGHLFQRLERLGNGGLTRILGVAAAQGGEEGLQEALQQVIQNATSRGLLDPRTPITEDVANSFLTAAASGALMGGGGAAIAKSLQRGADNRPVPNLAPAPEPPPELPPELAPAGQQPAATAAPLPADSVPAAPADNAAPAVRLPAEAAPVAREGAVPSPAAPSSPAEEPLAQPAPKSQAAPDEAKLLLGAGYTPEQIAEMNREEIEQATADEREAGTKPAETLPPELQPDAALSPSPSPVAVPEAPSAPPPKAADPDAALAKPVTADTYQQAVDIVRGDGKASTSYIQRKLQLRYEDAAALMDRMEKEGVVGPASHSGKRDVLPVPGTRSAPVVAEKPEDVAAAAAVANPEPTPAQAEAGNYAHGHLKFDGFDIAIENAKGSTRRGTDADGAAWETQMPAHYGRIKGTKGADGDQVDVYIGDHPPNGRAWVIDQFDPNTGKFDEVKVVMGVANEAGARAIYEGGFSDGSGPARNGGIREVSTGYLRSWLDAPGRTGKPFTPEGRAKAAGKNNPAARAPTPAAEPPKGQAAIREGKLPVVDARETQRDENVRKLHDQFRPKDKVSGAFFDHLVDGGSFPNILQARKMAKEQAEEDVKKVEEAMELAVVSAAKVVTYGKSEAQAFDALVDLYGRQPNLNTRTSTSVRDQAYSTPIPLAYVAQKLARIGKADFVYEPTAGNGALLFTADPDRVVANELNKSRGDNLEAQGYAVTDYDASAETTRTKIDALNGGPFDVVIGNPPFGTVQENGHPKVFDLNASRAGYQTTQIDHAIVVRTLGLLKTNGRAVFIIGAPAKTANAADSYHGERKRAFFKFLWDYYNVADHFTVGGNLYSRQGTSWPVDVIVIDGRGKTERPLPAVTPPPVLTSWDQVKEKLDGSVREGSGKAPADVAAAGPAGTAVPVPVDSGPAGSGGASGQLSEPANAEGVREPAVQQGSQPEGGAAGEQNGPGQDRPGGSNGPDARAPAKRRPSRVENADEAFDAAFDQLFGEKPAAAPQAAAPAAPAGPRADTRTPGQIVKSAATETAMGLDDALSGLYQLFGGGKTVGSGPVFDEETYAKAKPFFVAAAQHLKNAAKDLVALAKAIMQAMVDKFGDAARDTVQRMRPYIVRFVGDVKDGKIDLTARPQQQEKPQAPQEQEEAPKERKSAPAEKETDKQVTYTARSKHPALGTLMPINMQTAMQTALDKVEAEHGDIDKFVADELGYQPGSKEFLDSFAAEQIDALALALANFKKGAGFIIGDQTGIGKGRVNAGVIRWAIKNGLTPIFVTEKPNLYGDMYRDLSDIKIQNFLGREPRLFMTNVNESVPLDKEALDNLADRDTARQLGQPLLPKTGNFLEGGTSKAKEKLLEQFTAAGKPGDHDVVFTTYNQMQTVKGAETERTKFLKAIAPNAVLIFDESHNAGGQEGKPRVKKGQPPPIPRAQTARDLVNAARAVFYSSATFAKRPSVMDLYSKTDMRLAVDDIEKLAQAIKDGGVPMQQVVSTMLAEAGQYIRRERSFDGVVYDTPVVDVDREKYDEFAGALQEILGFSNYVRGATAEIAETIKAEAESVVGDDSTGEAGAESLNFTSVMHNLIGQYLLAAKADIAADRAIAALKNGEKPVLTVASTLESFLSEFAADNDLKAGSPIAIDFAQLLQRYLERTRQITIKDAYGNKTKHYLTDEELGPAGLDAYHNAKQFIADLDFGDLPVSPIDWIHHRLRKAGYTTAEITGRGMTIQYNATGRGVLKARPASEVKASGRKVNIERFNNEKVDVEIVADGVEREARRGVSSIILNQAGSTGLSLHAKSDYQNRQKRVMIIVQAEANIDTHMQMLGRVHRTGQVVLPRYEQLIANVPAEKRPAAVLQKKMASLNASTTASREGALTGKDVPDFINQYGDIIAKQWLDENSDISRLLGDLDLGEQKKEADPTEDGAMRKLTGRIPLLDLALQEAVYEDLEQRYADLIEQLEATGLNALEAKALDLDAKQQEAVTLREGHGDSPFDGPATLGIYDIKRQGKPVTGAEVLAALARAASSADKANADYYGSLVLSAGTDRRKVAQAIDAINNRIRKASIAQMEDALKAGRAYITEMVNAEETDEKKEAVRQKLTENLNRFDLLMRQLDPGHKVRLTLPDGEVYTGIVMKVDHGGKAKNPLALGTWRATVAVPLNNPMVPISLASLQSGDEDGKIKLEDATFEPLETTLDLFDQLAAGGAREKRIIATGNILAAFSALKGKGQIISFTDNQGRKQPGIMMPAKLKKLTDITDTIGRPLTTAPEVLEFLASKGGGPIFDAGRNLEISGDQWGFSFKAQGAKGKGGKFYLNPDVLQATGRDFVKAGPYMKVEVAAVRAPAVIDALIKAGARFEAPPAKKPKPAGTSQRVIEPAPAPLTAAGEQVQQIVRDIVAQVVGTQNVRLQTPERAFSEDAEATARSGGSGGVGMEISGSVQHFISAKPVLTVALAQGRDAAVDTAFHEAFHVLQGYQAITNEEREILRREHDRMLIAIQRTGRSTTTMTGSEVEAYAFELYASARRANLPTPPGLHIGVRRIFEKLLDIIARIGNKLRGLGYRSADDVFAAAFTGETGARIGTDAQVERRAASPMRGVAYSTFKEATQRDLEAYNRNAGYTPPAPAAARPKSFQESKASAIEKGLRKVQDDFVDLRRYQQDITSQIGPIPEGQDAYNAATLFAGRVPARLEDFKTDHVEPLIKAMVAADVGREELGTGLLARHAVERNAFIKARDPSITAGSGLADDAARAIIADMQASGLWARLQPLFAQVDAMIEADRRVRLAAGLIDQNTYQDWKNRFQSYVPLQGTNAEDEAEADGFKTGWGFDVRGRESQIAFGRYTIPNNPLDNVIAQAQAGIIRAEKNRVDRALLKLVQANPNPDLWRVNERRYKKALNDQGKTVVVQDHSLRSEPNVLGVKVGGKVTYITLKDMQLAEAFRQLPNDASRNAVVRGIGQLTRGYAQLQTGKNLDFFVRNVPRDLQEAVYTLFHENPRLVPSFVTSFPKAIRVALGQESKWLGSRMPAGDRAIFDEWRRNGGQITFTAYRDVNTISEEMRRELGDTDSVTLARLPGLAARAVGRTLYNLFLRWVAAINEGFENSTRLAVYMAARKNGYSPARAARLSREATVNFTRRGQWTTTISAFKMFFNPNVQGNVKTLQMLAGERNATDEQKARTRRARILYGSLVPLGSMIAMWNLAAGGDDEDEKRPGKRRSLYMSIPDYVRDQNIVLIYGTHVVNGKRLPLYVKIPKAFGLGVPITLGEQMVLLSQGQQTIGGAAGATMRSILGVMNPLGSQNPLEAGFWLNQIAPTLMTPGIDMTLNRDWTGRPIVPPTEPWNRGMPHAEQSFSTNSAAAIDTAKWLRDKSGGNVDLYPGHIQYMVGWLTGGAGRFYKGTWDAAQNALAGVPTPMERMPILRQFTGAVDTAAEQDLYYKNRTEAAERFNRVNAAKNALQAGSTDEIVKRDFQEGARDLGLRFSNGRFDRKHSLLGAYDAADKEVKAIRERINEIRRNRTVTIADREKQVADLRNQMDTVMRRTRRAAAAFPAYQNQ
ncbi:LPD38 domain-containing protein [uncultured Alsobacter sp.]|uniref:LPD38 domain-containing protein n=1 Tax=uncultured Alsobacter sp. TaxID=1748258 RepID=UPI0025E25990|nr:LPD38 domain-containing protein [uncultured Alsobacter sp.]